jgi:hypothetical protein
LNVTKVPAGEYLLAVSGFHFGDTWDFTLGENQTRPGFASIDGKGKPAPLELTDEIVPETIPAPLTLTGQSFASYLVPAVQLDFNVDAKVPWRLEYSGDGATWHEGGGAQQANQAGLVRIMATPPFARTLPPGQGQGQAPLPGYDPHSTLGFVRIRNLQKHLLLPADTSPAQVLAVPTEVGVNYQFNTSDDLSLWLEEPAIPGDGSVFQWVLGIEKERGFARIKRN